MLMVGVVFGFALCDAKPVQFQGYVEGEYQHVMALASGPIQQLTVQKGSAVKAGDALFQVEDIQLKHNVWITEAQYQAATVAENNAKQDYDRAAQLLAVHRLPLAELELKATTRSQLSASSQVAEQQYKLAQKQLEDACARALVDAEVADIFYTEGEFVTRGQPVLRLLMRQKRKIRFFVPQSALPKLAIGQRVNVHIDGLKEPIQAQIRFIASRAEYTPPMIYSLRARQKMVFLVEASPVQESESLHPGLPVDVSWVPTSL